jgi:hypothetical protein
MLPHWLLLFGRQKATAAGRKQQRFRSSSVIGVSPCLLGNTGEAQEKRAPAVWGVAPLRDAPVCKGPSLDTGNLALTRHRGRSTVRVIPVIPNVLGGAALPRAAFASALHFEVSSWGSQCAVRRVS